MDKLVCMLFGCVCVMGACTTPVDTEKIVIASRQGDCVGVMPQKCLLIKEKGSEDWTFFYDNIEGFNYEPGYEYVIEIKRDTIEAVAADRSSIKYVFVKEVSKTQKDSEGLPPMRQN